MEVVREGIYHTLDQKLVRHDIFAYNQGVQNIGQHLLFVQVNRQSFQAAQPKNISMLDLPEKIFEKFQIPLHPNPLQN